MASDASKLTKWRSAKATTWNDLFRQEMVWYSWIPLLMITVAHYTTGAEHHWLHDIYRRLYYFPIMFAAVHRGLWGGLALAVASSIAYAPHAFHHLLETDPDTHLEKAFEIIMYNVCGVVCGFLADAEERKRQEAATAKQEERGARYQLQRAQRLASLGELVAGIAHEIKNPLHTLKGTAEIVDKIVPRGRPESEMWKTHQEELGRLERVAERFLSFARPIPPQLTLTPVRDVMRRAEELLSAQARKNNVDLSVEISSGMGDVNVDIDRDQIVQVLVDIALNGFTAMKACSEKKMLIFARVDSESGGEYAAISLQNSGPPIPEDDLERIFDPFFTTREDGTGLGLSTAARIVQQHGGFLDVQNLHSKGGVQFSVHIPKAA